MPDTITTPDVNRRSCPPGRLAATLLAVVLLARSAPNADAQCHAITDLGTLPGASEIRVFDMNNVGQVVGVAFTDTVQAYVYTNGMMINLGSLGGGFASANAVNDAGTVVGSSLTAGGQEHAFISTPQNGMTDIGTLGGLYSAAFAINNAGQVAGLSTAGDEKPHLFLWQNGNMTDLGIIGTSAGQVWDINHVGDIVGAMQVVGGAQHAFVWTTAFGFVDLGTFGGLESYAYSINDIGQVVGGIWAGNNQTTGLAIGRAFLYTNGISADIGTLGGQSATAFDINHLGQVVGTADTVSGYQRAFVYDTNSGMRNLNELIAPDAGWTLISANAVNGLGQIAGVGVRDNQQRVFVLTPDQTDANADGIPDACTPGFGSEEFGCGLGMLPFSPLMLLPFAPRLTRQQKKPKKNEARQQQPVTAHNTLPTMRL